MLKPESLQMWFQIVAVMNTKVYSTQLLFTMHKCIFPHHDGIEDNSMNAKDSIHFFLLTVNSKWEG